ncbi:MAG TPA: hypothetical protein VIU62_22485 [Chloroflexota bacterium]|jgi:hypothetical protein
MAVNQDPGAEQSSAPAPDPEDRTPTERRKIEHVSGFHGDTQQMPLEGEQAVDQGGTNKPPISSLPPDEAAEVIELLDDSRPQ